MLGPEKNVENIATGTATIVRPRLSAQFNHSKAWLLWPPRSGTVKKGLRSPAFSRMNDDDKGIKKNKKQDDL